MKSFVLTHRFTIIFAFMGIALFAGVLSTKNNPLGMQILLFLTGLLVLFVVLFRLFLNATYPAGWKNKVLLCDESKRDRLASQIDGLKMCLTDECIIRHPKSFLNLVAMFGWELVVPYSSITGVQYCKDRLLVLFHQPNSKNGRLIWATDKVTEIRAILSTKCPTLNSPGLLPDKTSITALYLLRTFVFAACFSGIVALSTLVMDWPDFRADDLVLHCAVSGTATVFAIAIQVFIRRRILTRNGQ